MRGLYLLLGGACVSQAGNLNLALFEEQEQLANCTFAQTVEMETYKYSLYNCIINHECGGADDWEFDDNNNRRRRLQDEEGSFYDQYKCYCSKCSKWLEGLQDACTACNAVNYQPDCEEDDNGDCAEEVVWDYSQHCVINDKLIAAHQDSFCALFEDEVSQTCLQEMEYIVNPPPEEEDDGGEERRRLQEDEMVAVEDLLNCWVAPFMGGSSYTDMDACINTCVQYANQTYSYMENFPPTQTCGLSMSYLDTSDMADTYLPEPIRDQGVGCVSSACSEDDLSAMLEYLMGLASYKRYVDFAIEGQDGGEEEENDVEMVVTIPATEGSWKCDGEGGEGEIRNDMFPHDDEVEPSNETGETSSSDAKWATATSFAIICGLGMGVFMFLFIWYHRKVTALQAEMRTAQAGAYGSTGPAAA